MIKINSYKELRIYLEAMGMTDKKLSRPMTARLCRAEIKEFKKL